MTLLDAFRACGPVDGTAEVVEIRQAAFEIIYAELHRLARCLRVAPDVAEDLASMVACRLAQNGPRGEHAEGPDCDGAVVGYLARCLRNARADLHRQQPLVSLDDRDPADPSPSVEQRLDSEMARRALADAARRLHDVVLPWTLERLRRDARANVEAALPEILDVNDGIVRICDLARRLYRGDGPAECNKVHKRHQRARDAVFTGIDGYCSVHAVTFVEHQALLTAAAQYRRRS